MRTDELVSWLLDGAETVLSNASFLQIDTPRAHVDVADAYDEQTYPFVGVRLLAAPPESSGLGNGSTYASAVSESAGSVDSVTETVRRTASVEVVPVTDDDPARRERLGDALALYYGSLTDAEVPADATVPEVQNTTPQGRPDDLVRASGIELSITYTTSDQRPLTAAETVTTNVDADDDGDDESVYSFTLSG